MAAVYLAKMGIDAGLLALTKTVKFEDIHVLTRDEIARFGIDRREAVGDAPGGSRATRLNMVRKIAVGQVDRAKPRSGFCNGASSASIPDRFVLDFQRPIPRGPYLGGLDCAQRCERRLLFNGQRQ